MAIKLSGMISGMDTDAMIDELVKAYSVRKDSYVKEQKALEYKQDAWKEMNSKIYKLFSGKMSSMRFSSAYSVKTVKASNESKVTVSGSSSAVNGTQELKITNLAKSGYLTGGVVGTGIKGDSKLSELGVSATGGNITLKVNGKNTTIEVKGDMTVNSLVAKLKDAGVNASFDENNQRFFISSKNSGKDNDFSLNGDNAAGTDVLNKLGLYTVSSTDISAYQAFIDGADADKNGVITDAENEAYLTAFAKDEYLDSLVSEYVKTLEADKAAVTGDIDAENKKIAEAKDYISFSKLSADEQTEKMTKLDEKIEALKTKITEAGGTLVDTEGEEESAEIAGYKEELKNLQKQYDTYDSISKGVEGYAVKDFEDDIADSEARIKGGTLSDGTVVVENESLNAKVEAFDEQIKDAKSYTSATITDAEKFLTDNGMTVNYSSTKYEDILQKYKDKLAYANEMVDAYAEYNSESTSAADKEELAKKLGISTNENGPTRIVGEDAEIYLNGAKFESNTNVFQINGLTITAQAETDDDETISVTTATDVDGIYNMVKDFFKEYNEVMKAMEEAYNAASAGDYEPLTDEEMEAMTDKQIEKWETKVKDAVLRRDSTLSGIINLLKTNMMKSFDVNGEKLSLSSFGIKTLGYFNAGDNEKGLYHIDGDADDSAVSGNTDKLKAAIASDPERFVSFFSQLTQNVYMELNRKMSSSTLSSAYTVYNDKYMKQQYDRYDDKISDWEDKVDAIREKYEKQFASMETALSQLQSNSSYLSSMLG